MTDDTVLELRVRWGDQLLHISHAPPERELWVGDDRDGPVAFAAPMARTRVVPGVLADGALTIEAELCSRETVPSGHARRGEWLGAWAFSALLHAIGLGAVSLQPPGSLDPEDEPIDRALLAKASGGLADPAFDERQSERIGPPSASGNDLGAAHKAASGALGRTTNNTDAHFAIMGPPETTEAKLARARALIESSNYGAISALAAIAASTGPCAADDDENLGTDARSVVGNLFGSQAGEAFGPNGLGLSGTGEGGGSAYGGIGIGISGVFGSGGFAHGSGSGIGAGYGGGGGGTCAGPPRPCARRTRPVRMIEGSDDVQGTLPPEAVRRIVRANFPRFRACYESGLKKDPSLAGTIAVRFIIDSTGAVETVSAAGGTLSDGGVRNCVASVYRTLSFPEPEGGKVLVTYPIDFQPE